MPFQDMKKNDVAGINSPSISRPSRSSCQALFGTTASDKDVYDLSLKLTPPSSFSRSGCATANEIRSNTPALEDKVQRSNILPNSNTHNQNKSLNLHRVSNE